MSSQMDRVYDLIWGTPITAIEIDPTPIDEWFKNVPILTLCTEEFTYSHCKTSRGTKENDEVDYTTILDIVNEEFGKFLDFLGPKCGIDSNFEVPWINIYGKNGFQDSHDHQGDKYSDFSYCYVHESGDSHIVFKNRFATNSDMCLKDLLHAYYAQDYVPTLKKKGTLYIFPSTAYHSVSPNKSDDPRITISGNIKLTPEDK